MEKSIEGEDSTGLSGLELASPSGTRHVSGGGPALIRALDGPGEVIWRSAYWRHWSLWP